MKCIISNRIWGDSSLGTDDVKNACTYKIPLSDYEAMLASTRGGLPYRVIKTYTRPAENVS